MLPLPHLKLLGKSFQPKPFLKQSQLIFSCLSLWKKNNPQQLITKLWTATWQFWLLTCIAWCSGMSTCTKFIWDWGTLWWDICNMCKSDSVPKASFIATLPVILIRFKSHISQRDYRLDTDFLQIFWRLKCCKNSMYVNEYTFFKK